MTIVTNYENKIPSVEVKEIKEINKRHKKRGSISREDQQSRQAIAGKYYRRVI